MQKTLNMNLYHSGIAGSYIGEIKQTNLKCNFTLIELIATIIIITITMTMAIPHFINLENEARIQVIVAGIVELNLRERNVWAKMILSNDPAYLSGGASLDQAIYDSMDFDLNAQNTNDWTFVPGSAGIFRTATLQLQDDLEVDILRKPATQSAPAIWEQASTEVSGINNSYDNIQGQSTIEASDGDDQINVENYVQDGSIIDTGDGDDQITVGENVQGGSTIDTGDGNDVVTISGGMADNATINTGNGDDQCTIAENIKSGSSLNTGDGQDTIQITGTLQDDASIDSGNGDDTISIGRIQDTTTIDSGSGNDTVNINNVSGSFDTGQVSLGDGNDSLTMNDSLSGSEGTFSGGTGDDNLILSKVSSNDWNNGIKDLFSGFESVTLKDGTSYSLDDSNNLTPN